MARLAVQNLIKTYNERQVVNSVSLNIESGDVVGLLGPNGAGKTTTFYMTIGMVKPDAGQVFLDDENITLDANPPLAGMALNFSIELVGVG